MGRHKLYTPSGKYCADPNCAHYGVLQPLDHFRLTPKRKTLNSYCIPCANRRQRLWRARHHPTGSTKTHRPVRTINNGTLFCVKCKQDWPIQAFHKNKQNRSTGYHSYCKACRAALRLATLTR